MDAGLVVYGPDERLEISNTRYKELYARSAHLMNPGTPYEDILRESYRAGNYAHTGLTEDEWVVSRLALHRNAEGTLRFGTRLNSAERLRLSLLTHGQA